VGLLPFIVPAPPFARGRGRHRIAADAAIAVPPELPMNQRPHTTAFLATTIVFLFAPLAHGQEGDVIKRYTRTEAMVPMRDGVRLYTAIYTPKDIPGPLPVLLLRTPYGIQGRPEREFKNYLAELAREGYIFAYQDIRGRFKSEGQFIMLYPQRDRSDPKSVDETSDAYDTVAWLVKNVPDNNGKVGMLGISYGGWLTAVALLEPHPALKAISPQASPADMFLGDDFHHNGAFRLSYGFEYVAMMETDKKNTNFRFDRHDTYEWYLGLGALSHVNAKIFRGKMPSWNDFVAHPNYDAFWQRQALAPTLKKVTVPTLNVAGWWDQEDFYGPLKIYEALEKHDSAGQNFLVVGPWNHGGWVGRGDSLGRIRFGSPTGKYFREKVQAPWFAHFLKGKGKLDLPEALTFQTGTNRWVAHDRWPPPEAHARKLYFQPGGKLAFTPPPEGGTEADEYLSDPANPVPYRPRPVRPTYPGPEWRVWMVEDQRFANQRPDVLGWETEPLKEDLTLAGGITARLYAATTGSDCDWVVRLIDVYPESYPADTSLGGYQLMVAGEVLRARYRKSFAEPEPVVPGQVTEYAIDLHWNHHCFRKGHKILVQVQSSWFPLIDRNPQKYVENIFTARDEDFRAARQRVFRSPRHPSHLALPVWKTGRKKE
jgi:putative CocE/NonD family hydrolase